MKMQYYDTQLMSAYLKNNGFTEAQIEKMNDEEISNAYQQKATTFLNNYKQSFQAFESSHEPSGISIHTTPKELTPQIISIINQHHIKLYELLDDFMDIYAPNELIELLYVGMQNIKMTQLEKMVRIKVYELQEFWLEQIENNLNALPIEERDELMDYYQSQKSNLKLLKETYLKSKDKQYIQQLQDIADTKLEIIKEHLPSELEANYKSFYNKREEKTNLIQEILELSHGFGMHYLNSSTIADLKELLMLLQTEQNTEKEQKQLYTYHMKALKDSLTNPDEQVFAVACLNAANELPRYMLQDIVKDLADRNKFFLHRFHEVAKEYKNIPELQIIL